MIYLYLDEWLNLYKRLNIVCIYFQIKMQKEVVKKQLKEKKKWVNPLRDRTRVIPFVVPNKEQQMCALGTLAGEKWKIKKSLLAILQDFAPIKTPQPGDNLFQFQEQGQGFGLFASRSRNHIDEDKQIIYVATFCCKITKDTLKRIRKCVKAFFYGVKVKFHEFPKTDLSKFAPMQGASGQIYYDAAKMNTYFAKNLPKNTYSVAILTNLLIYNGDNPRQQIEQKWVYGLGSIKDRTCVISFQQIVLKGFGCKREQNQEDQSQINVQFLIKVVNHEICHTFAMRHCIYYTCLMNGSNHYQEAIAKDEHLCPICIRKLQLALNFNFAERYEALGGEKSLMLAEKIKNALALNSK